MSPDTISLQLPAILVAFAARHSDRGLAILSLAIAVALAGLDAGPYFLGFMGLCALCLAAVDRWPHRVVAIVGIALVLAAFVYLRRYSFLAKLGLRHTIPFVAGIGYILFRVIHLILDRRSGEIAHLRAMDVVNYLLFFPTFVTGPIQRYEDFSGRLRRRAAAIGQADDDGCGAALLRIAKGYVKVAVLAETVLHLHHYGRHWAEGMGLPDLALAVAALTYLIFLYNNFSGAIDIVIGGAFFAGITLPENFNRPFAAESMIDFWGRWHITLSEWFRDYVFMPLSKGLYSANWANLEAIGIFATFVSFFLLGLWHGSTYEFVVCAFMLGTGVAANRLFRLGRKQLKRRAPPLARQLEGSTFRMVARGAVLGWIAVSIAAFWLPIDGMISLVRNDAVAPLRVIGWAIVLATAGAGLLRAGAALLPVGRLRFGPAGMVPVAALCAMVLVIAPLIAFAIGDDEVRFVYGGF